MNAPLSTNVAVALPPRAFACNQAFIDNWFFPPRRPMSDKNGRLIKKNHQPKDTKNETHQECGVPIDQKHLSQPLSSSLSRACKGMIPLPKDKDPAAVLLKGQERLASRRRRGPRARPAAVVQREERVEETVPVSQRSVKNAPVDEPPVVVLQREQGAHENLPAPRLRPLASRRRRRARHSVREGPATKAVVVLQREEHVEETVPVSRRSVKEGPTDKAVVVHLFEVRVQEKAPASRRSVKEGPVIKPPVVLHCEPDHIEEKPPISRHFVKEGPAVKPVVVLQGERQSQEKSPASRGSVKETPVVKPPVVVLRESRVQEKAPVSRRLFEKPPIVKPVAVLQRGHDDKVSTTKMVKAPPGFSPKTKCPETRDDKVSTTKMVKAPPGFSPKTKCPETRDDKMSATKTVKTPPGSLTNPKRTETRDDRVWAAWEQHHQALFTSLNKNANKTNEIPLVVFTNQYVVPEDAVSVLYDDADVDDEDCLPPATIAILENFFDGLDSDGLETDDESSWSSSDASYQETLYRKMLAAPPFSPSSYQHFDLDMMGV